MALKLDEFLTAYKTTDEKLTALRCVAAELNDDLLHEYEHANEKVTESIRQDARDVEAKIQEVRGRK